MINLYAPMRRVSSRLRLVSPFASLPRARTRTCFLNNTLRRVKSISRVVDQCRDARGLTSSTMGGGDVWNALRGQVVHTGKHAEVWENMDKFDRGRREAADAAARGGGDRGSDRGGREGGGSASADGNVGGYRKVRGPDGQMMSGAQMRNARNAEGTVDWKCVASRSLARPHVSDASFVAILRSFASDLVSSPSPSFRPSRPRPPSAPSRLDVRSLPSTPLRAAI